MAQKDDQINIKSAACAKLLAKFAKQDAKKRASKRPNKTATLYEILTAEDQRRTFTWRNDIAIAAAQTQEMNNSEEK